MILVYSKDRVVRTECVAALVRTCHATESTDDWVGFVNRWPSSCCLVVHVPRFSGSIAIELPALRFARPLLPLVMVTDSDKQNLLALGPVAVDAIVATDELWHDLPRVAGPLIADGVLGRVGRFLEATPYVDDRLRRALIALCRADPPLSQVADLAKLGSRPERLEELWRAYGHDTTMLRLEDAVTGVLLFRAVRLRGTCGNWKKVADGLGMNDTRRLERVARRLLGRTLADLNRLGPAETGRRIVDRIFMPLIEACAAPGSF